MVGNLGVYYRVSNHLRDWLMDNFDKVDEVEREKIILEILYYKFLIKCIERSMLSLN